MIKKLLITIFLVIIVFVILFLCFPYSIGAMFSKTHPGQEINIATTKKYDFEPPEKIDDEKALELKSLLSDWQSLKDSEKAPFIELAKDLTFNCKINGLSILSVSSQQKNINLYYKYALFRVNNLNNEAKLNSDWWHQL